MGLTFLQENAFEFHPGINVPDNINRLTKGTAYTCLLTILKSKLKILGTPKCQTRDKCYFLKGRTGSGKSTYFPCKMFLDLKVSIWVLEPAVILAQSIPTDTVKYFKELTLGKNIGYLTGQGKIKPTANHAVTFMTTEIFRQALVGGQKLPKIVIIDEVHKMDKALMFCLQALKDRIEDIKGVLFIFQSATIDLPLLLNYFIGEEDYNYDLVGYVAGAKNFPCEEIWIPKKTLKSFENNPDNIITYIMEDVLPRSIKCTNTIECNKRNIPARDIMLFVCGKRSMMILRKPLEKYRSKIPIHIMDLDESSFQKVPLWRSQNKNTTRLLVIPYIQTVNTFGKELLQYNVDPDPESQMNEIKLFISTPVLEAGKTIDTLYQVIDTGLRHEVRYNPLLYTDERNQDLLFRVPADKSSIEQRIGRVGRKSPGIIIRMYSKSTYEMIPERTIPDNINNVSFANIVVDAIQNDDELNEIDLLEDNNMIIPNSVDTILKTQQDLVNIGSITTFGSVIQDRTNLVNQLTLQSNALRFIQGCSYEEAFFYSRLNRNNFTQLLAPMLDVTKTKHNDSAKEILNAILDTRKYFFETVETTDIGMILSQDVTSDQFLEY